MKGLIAAAVTGVVLVAATPAQAAYLSKGEFGRALGKQLRKNFEYGAQAGSLYVGDCQRRGQAGLRCAVVFTDLDGDDWCGQGRVRDSGAYYTVGWTVRGC